MRTKPILSALFPQVRQSVLAATFTQPDKWWYLSELAVRLNTGPSSLQRELSSLVASGILAFRRDGKRTYFKADRQAAIFPELRSLFEKTAGLETVVGQMLKPFDTRIQCAFVYGSVARRRDHATSDVDLVIIGSAGLADLSPTLRRAERLLGREINVMVYSAKEFRAKTDAADHFVAAVMQGRKIFVKGGQGKLDKVTGK